MVFYMSAGGGRCAIRSANVEWVAMRRRPSLIAVVLALILSLPTMPPASAAVMAGLYETVVTPADKPKDSAFAEAMRQVAVRVSGSRDAADKVMALKPSPDPRRFVQEFSFKPDGATQVRFNSASFDQLLTNAGLPIWGRERPAVLVWMSVPNASGRSGWQGATDRSPEREALEKAATARGIPLLWPSLDATDLGVAAGLTSSARSYEQIVASGERYRADALLVGVATRDGGGVAVMRWTFAFGGEAVDVNGAIEDGLHLAADICARSLAMSAGVRQAVAVQVAGIRDLDAYAQTLSYLEGLTIVRGVSVQQLQGDKLDVVLTVRGDASALRRTIGLGKRLSALPGDSVDAADTRLRYEFQP